MMNHFPERVRKSLCRSTLQHFVNTVPVAHFQFKHTFRFPTRWERATALRAKNEMHSRRNCKLGKFLFPGTYFPLDWRHTRCCKKFSLDVILYGNEFRGHQRAAHCDSNRPIILEKKKWLFHEQAERFFFVFFMGCDRLRRVEQRVCLLMLEAKVHHTHAQCEPSWPLRHNSLRLSTETQHNRQYANVSESHM